MKKLVFNSDIIYILKTFFFILFYILFSMLLITVVLIDVTTNKNVIEGGLTEKIQILLIVGSGFLYAIQAIKGKDFKRCNSLVAVLFSLFFVRELDAFFDNIFFHGAWFYVVLEILLLTFLYFYGNFKGVLREFVRYTQTPRFVLLVSGLISLIFLCRLIGYKEIWKELFFNIPIDGISEYEKHYRPFKNVAEEASEIIAYLILFFSAINPFSNEK